METKQTNLTQLENEWAVVVQQGNFGHEFRVNVLNPPYIGADYTNSVSASENIKKNIDLLVTGIMASIRQGGDMGILNKAETVEQIIIYLKTQYSLLYLPNDDEMKVDYKTK